MTAFKLNEVAWGYSANLAVDLEYVHHLSARGVLIEALPIVAFADDMCFDNKGNLYIATQLVLNKIPKGGVEELFFTHVRTNWNVRPVTTDSKGKYIYTADSDTNDASSTHWVILKLDQDGVEQQRWLFPRTGNFEAHALALYDNDTRIAFITEFSLEVKVLDLITGLVSTLFTLPSSIGDGFSVQPEHVIVLSDGTILVGAEEYIMRFTMDGTLIYAFASWEPAYLNQSDPGNSFVHKFAVTKGEKSVWVVYEDDWTFSPEFPLGALHISLEDYSLLDHYRFPRTNNDQDYAIAVNNRVTSGGSFGTVIGAT